MSQSPEKDAPKKSQSKDAKLRTSDGATVGTAELTDDANSDEDKAAELSGDNKEGLTPAAVGERLRHIFDVAETYGQRSFNNYAQIRSLAENVRDGFCNYLNSEGPCVFLVPPEGRFAAQNYQSAAFSVAGKGYLPLTPISFGLAVLVSEDRDYVRVKMTCRKEGDEIFIRLERGAVVSLALPLKDESFEPLFEALYQHLIDYFKDQIDDYDNGRYGVREIGFDIQRMTT